MARYKAKLNIVELEQGDYHTLVKGSVSGMPIRVVLDTGASHSCVDSNFVKERLPELVTSLHDGVTAGIGGDDFEVRIADIPDFKIGRYHLDFYKNIALIDFSYINIAYQRLRKKPIQMILGNDFFVTHRAVIDYNENMIYFEK